MSHITGTLQTLATSLPIGPDTGDAQSSLNTWAKTFHPDPAAPPGGLKFAILHFTTVILPANNRLEVDLGYDTDVFTSADGTDFWTRPVNVAAFAGGDIPIRYIINGAGNGSAQLTQYGRGERHIGKQDPNSLSNSDPFLLDAMFSEPTYDPEWLCDPNIQNWENIFCENNINDIRRIVAKSVGMVVHVYHDTELNADLVSTCSVTLIGADLVITAGHCIVEEALEVSSASVIFNYETDCFGNRINPYTGFFYKVKKRIKHRWLDASFDSYDYCILQLKLPGAGIPITPINMRQDLPAPGEQVFGVHHPNGVIKKLSQPHPGFALVNSSVATGINVLNLDVSGGSSGSGLFDTMGRITGILSGGLSCTLSYFPTATILQDIAATPVPSPGRDTMLVFDRSGSMSLPAGTGKTKMQEAKDAASLFVQLLQTGGGNKIGLVSFSTAASNPIDFGLGVLNNNAKDSLIGNVPPYSAGVVGNLLSGGSTSIGGGLQAAHAAFGGGNNQRTILLLTDGLQNAPPMIETINPSLSDSEVHVIGFGTESSLDGTLLNKLAQDHNGFYTRAGDPLNLKKFFAMAFGNIFQNGTLADPEFFLPALQNQAKPLSFPVCGEESITVVLGWDRSNEQLELQLVAPGGMNINSGMPGIESSNGNTWTFLRLDLPFNGERDGTWKITVNRLAEHGAITIRHTDLKYFVNVIVKGGPRLRLINRNKKYFTGDIFNPLLTLAMEHGEVAPNGKVKLTIIRPADSIGNILSRSKLQPPESIDQDTIPARQSTLQALEKQTSETLINYKEETFDLLSDPVNAGGFFEPEGIYGRILKDVLRTEGNYTLHARASYGEDCTAARELIWTIHVESGIDPSKTTIETSEMANLPGGHKKIRINITPKDIYENYIGPGRRDFFSVNATSGSVMKGTAKDNGDGSYSVIVNWDPASGFSPGVVISVADRPSILVAQPFPQASKEGGRWKLWFLILLMVLILLLVYLIFRV